MVLQINSNITAQIGLRNLSESKQDISKILRNIATGLKINQASDDPAGNAVSEKLRSITEGLDRAESNIQDSASALQVAEGGIEQINGSLQRIRELSVQASNGTLTDADRSIIQTEINQLVEEVDRQASSTTFNGQNLLDGTFDSDPLTTQSGAQQGETIDTTIASLSATSLGVNGFDVSTQSAAENSLSTIDTALSRVNDQRATIGANVNRLESAQDFVGVARENTLSALSQIRDADLAASITDLASAQIREQSGVAALGQANLIGQNVLQLLK
ncbi:MAG: flagellin FliC [Candidatus Lindowbacteria bacterium]|nr:flagellin FliC [Candidatus Lindowbacteria bacterium]